MQYTIDMVREDMHGLRFKKTQLAALLSAKREIQLQLAALINNTTEQQAAEEQLSAVAADIGSVVAEAAKIEAKYIRAICTLKPIYRTVLIEHYIRGRVRHQIAAEINYS